MTDVPFHRSIFARLVLWAIAGFVFASVGCALAGSIEQLIAWRAVQGLTGGVGTVVSRAINDRAGYQLMPEWATQPSNHYLPRRKTEITIHPEDLERVDNPLKIDGQQPEAPAHLPGREDYST